MIFHIGDGQSHKVGSIVGRGSGAGYAEGMRRVQVASLSRSNGYGYASKQLFGYGRGKGYSYNRGFCAGN